jgi:putative membrane protein
MTAEDGAALGTEALGTEAVTGSAARQAGLSGSGDWLWLSGRSLIVRPVTDLIRLLPVLLGVLFFGSSRGGGGYWGFGFAALAVVTSVVRFCTTRYRITDERVYLRHGLFNQQVLSVPRDRVRSVDTSAHVVYRMLGLRKVEIGTGRNDRREGKSVRLDAVTLRDAEALRATLLTGLSRTAAGAADVGAAAGQEGAAPAARPERELARLHPSWVRFAPLTLTGLVIVGVVVGSGAQVLDATHIDFTAIGPVHRLSLRFAALPPGQRVLDGAVAVLAVLVLLSVAGYIALFWNFRLTSQDGALRVSRGLLSTRTTTIDARRLRGAELSEPLLLRAARGARCLAITTGLRVGHGAERGGSLLLPPAPRGVAREVAALVLASTAVPGAGDPGGAAMRASAAGQNGAAGTAEPFTCGLIRHGPAARRRRYVRAVGGAALADAALAVLWQAGSVPGWAPLAALVLLPLSAAVAADRYASLGHRLCGGWLVTRTGSLVRRRSVLSADGIIGWRIHQSWFQRRQGLVSLAATTAAGRQDYVAHDIPVADALTVAAAATDLLRPFLSRPTPREEAG